MLGGSQNLQQQQSYSTLPSISNSSSSMDLSGSQGLGQSSSNLFGSTASLNVNTNGVTRMSFGGGSGDSSDDRDSLAGSAGSSLGASEMDTTDGDLDMGLDEKMSDLSFEADNDDHAEHEEPEDVSDSLLFSAFLALVVH